MEVKKNLEGKGGKYFEKAKHFLWRREKRRRKILGERKYPFREGQKSREGKGEKYLEREKVYFSEEKEIILLVEKKNGEGKREKYLERDIFFRGASIGTFTYRNTPKIMDNFSERLTLEGAGGQTDDTLSTFRPP